MAKTKRKAKTLSRREMVTLLGSGVVMIGSSGGTEVAAQAPPPPQPSKAKSTKAVAPPPPPPGPNACRTVVPMQGRLGTGAGAHTVLMGDPCCHEGMDIFFGGFDKAVPPLKGHLQTFANALNSTRGELLEYCVMVWGLKLEERTDLVKQVQEKYHMTEYADTAKK